MGALTDVLRVHRLNTGCPRKKSNTSLNFRSLLNTYANFMNIYGKPDSLADSVHFDQSKHLLRVFFQSPDTDDTLPCHYRKLPASCSPRIFILSFIDRITELNEQNCHQ